MNQWVDLRAGGKMHGRLLPDSMLLEVRHGDRVFRYDLRATAQARRPVVERIRVTDEKQGDDQPPKGT